MSGSSKANKPKEQVSQVRPTSELFSFNNSMGVWTKPTAPRKKAKGKDNATSNRKLKVEALEDIDAALSQLELNDRTGVNSRSKCDCMGTRHPLVEIAPNCMNCGRIICMKEGFGPCMFCGEAVLGASAKQNLSKMLNEERDLIIANMNRSERAHFGIKTSQLGGDDRALKHAQDHLSRLLQYQDSGAQRTKIIDQVSDFEDTSSGLNMWASREEQVEQLMRQQRQLRRQRQKELNRQGRGRHVLSIDLKGNKIYSTEPAESDSEDDPHASETSTQSEQNAPENSPFTLQENLSKLRYVAQGSGQRPRDNSEGSNEKVQYQTEDIDNESVILEM